MTRLETADRAERAGRAAKTAQRRRRDRERAVDVATATLLGIPLLFAAVWCRMEVSKELHTRDGLLARSVELERSVIVLDGERTRLMTWSHLGEKAGSLGLREPAASDVVWVPVRR